MRKDDLFSAKNKDKGASWVRWGVIIMLLMLAGFLIFCKPDRPAADAPQISPAPSVSPMPQVDIGRTPREASYEKDIAALEALLQREDVSENTREQAAQQISRMVENHQTELAIEEALQASGFAPCLVVMQGEAITVTLRDSDLSGTDGVTILSICVAHSDVAVENIRIITGEL